MRTSATRTSLFLPLAVILGFASCLPRAVAQTESCDSLAASPVDGQRPSGVSGVPFDKLDAARAIAACEADLKSSPNEPRFKYQLGRALAKANQQLTLALRLNVEAAEAGYIAAIYQVGYFYSGGLGVEQDHVKALEWFRKAAERGSSPGLAAIALAYAQGLGVTKDAAEATKWYRRAAEAGDTQAMLSLGYNLLTGTGTAKDGAAGTAWYRKAAEAGSAEGMRLLADALEHGHGGAKNEAEARVWYKKAAEAGSIAAMRNFASIVRSERGGPKDAALARTWLQKAAEAKDAESMWNVGKVGVWGAKPPTRIGYIGLMAEASKRVSPVLEEHFRFLIWLIPALNKFPRSQKFTLADRIQALAQEVLESLIEATYSRERRLHLARANMGLEKLRYFFRLSETLRV